MKKQLPRSPLDDLSQIVTVRGQRVMLDETLADLYGVSTKAFNQAVRRNRERFPPDFLLEIDRNEWEGLRSQIVTLEVGRGRHRKYLLGALRRSVASLDADTRRQFDLVYDAILGLMNPGVRRQ
jgi:hypothetical protein